VRNFLIVACVCFSGENVPEDMTFSRALRSVDVILPKDVTLDRPLIRADDYVVQVPASDAQKNRNGPSKDPSFIRSPRRGQQ
jgi:hypothetical protein